ncbi:MAG TPA: hypothetical protein VF902_00090 [Coriobacteriia bacterium]
MKRASAVLGIVTVLLLTPSLAHAADGSGVVGFGDITAAMALAAAAVLLVLAVLLERIARGSALAENLSYVVAAAVCLGAAALANWSVRLIVLEVTRTQVALAADGLSLVSIALLCVYFYRVRAALVRFQRIMTSVEPLAEMHSGTSSPAPAGGTEAAEVVDPRSGSHDA